ncbi:MAG: helix-turn-helix domain-containing protein [Dehalococcoidia bacterium]|nr:helix-turn-helix domain-containing protein [Dehalococcoidia bacterium]
MIESIFHYWFEELQPVMSRIAYHWSEDCPADRDDILQEMALKLFLVLRRRPDAPREYLIAAIRRVPLDYRARGSSVNKLYHKKRRRHWRTLSLDAILDESEGVGGRRYHPRWGDGHNSPVEDIVVAELMHSQLKERLTLRQAAFLELRLTGYGVDEVGKQLGLNRCQTNNVAIALRAKAKTLWEADGPVPGTDYATVEQAARELGVSPITVRGYCQRGLLAGTLKQGQQWLIPRPVQPPHAPVRPSKDPALATVTEAARELCLSQVTVAQFCRQGKIEGSYRQGRVWQIPRPIRLNGNHDGYMTAQDAARELGLKPVTIALLCRQGRLDGARMEKGRWLIPVPIKRLETAHLPR